MKQTTRSLLSVLVFTVVAGAVGLSALWVQKDEAKKVEQKEKSAKLFALDKAKLRGVRLEKAGQLVAAVKRADASAPWKLSEPAALEGVDADEATVAAIVDKLDTLKQKSELEGMDAKAAGLDGAARLRVTLIDDGGKEQALLVGEDNGFDASTYVKTAAEATIRLVATADKAPFEKTLFDLRDKRVAHLEPLADARKLEVLGVAAPFAAEKEGAAWKLTAPVAGKADGAAVDKEVQALTGLRATAIAAERADEAKLRELGLSPAKITARLTVAAAGGKDTYVRTVLVGQPAKAAGSVAVKTYAKRDDAPTVFEIDGQIVKDLDHPLFDLQDKMLLSLDREAVRRIDIENPGGETLSVARRKDSVDGGAAEETFEVLAPQKGPARKWKMSSLLFSLAGLKVAAFGEAWPKDAKALAQLGFDKPRAVTVFGEGDKVLARLEIGGEAGKEGKRRWVHAEGAPRVAEVEKSALDEYPRLVGDVLEPPPAPAAVPDGGLGVSVPQASTH